jgi:hypothetical protein
MTRTPLERTRQRLQGAAIFGLPLGLLFLVIAFNRPNIANLGFHDLVQFLGAGVTLGGGLVGLIVFLASRRDG